jgi:hypothetical protein
MDHHRAIMKITELEKRGLFAQFLEAALQRPECDGLDVLALLITPVQRILRYKLFLEDLIKCTPESHTDYKNLDLVLLFSPHLSLALNLQLLGTFGRTRKSSSCERKHQGRRKL